MLVLITGGAGFIGAHAAQRFRARGWRVSLLDDLSRRGAAENLRWLRRQGPVSFARADVRDPRAVGRWVRAGRRPDLILHLAAQVAVTTSLADPRADFEVNALGTLNVLEAARRLPRRPLVLYASTNKVYGEMGGARTRLRAGRWTAARAVAEDAPLDFRSPYGCSKGAADQYVRDYGRVYGLPTTVFRQSCVYGPRQHGDEDQGWVAHFLRAGLAGETVTVYGDGRQSRDLLYVADLLDAFEAAWRRRAVCAGGVYNVGGGSGNVLSLRELAGWVSCRAGRPLRLAWRDWRPGDQRAYVSDVSRARAELGWSPRVGVGRGLDLLWGWLRERRAR